MRYQQAHEQVWALHGPARERQCAECGGGAEQWAYDGSDRGEGCEWRPWGDRMRLVGFSPDPSHYRPLCRSCHIRVDQEAAQGRGNGDPLTDPPSAWQAVYDAALAACGHHQDAEDATQEAYLSWLSAGGPPVTVAELCRSARSALGGGR